MHSGVAARENVRKFSKDPYNNIRLQFHHTDTGEPTAYLYSGVEHFTYIQASSKNTLNISS